jgi:hypothetical protein
MNSQLHANMDVKYPPSALFKKKNEIAVVATWMIQLTWHKFLDSKLNS